MQLPGGRPNIKMSSYQYKDPHVKDKTVSQHKFSDQIALRVIRFF